MLFYIRPNLFFIRLIGERDKTINQEVKTMKKIIKKSIALVLAFAAILCFAGCNSFGQNVIFVKNSTDFELADEPSILFGAGQLIESDVEKINEGLNAEYPDEEISVVPVYGTDAQISMNDEIIRIYAIDPSHASFLGLEEMTNGTAYFADEQSSEIELKICVITEIEENGIVSGDLAYMTLDAQAGVSEKGLLSVLKDKCFTPSMLEEPVCFVTTNTFSEITALANGVENLDEAGSIFSVTKIIGICVYAENSKAVSEYLTELKYSVK